MLRRWLPLDLYEATALAVALAAYSRCVDLKSQLVGWDIDISLLEPLRALSRANASMAMNQGLGSDNATSLGSIPTYAGASVLRFLGVSSGATEWIILGIAFMLLPISMIAYCRVAFPGQMITKIVATLAIVFNFYVAITWYTPQLQFLIGLCGGPLLAAALVSYARTGRAAHLIGVMCVALVVAEAGTNAAVTLMMSLSAVVLICIAWAQARASLLRMVVGIFLTIGISAFWLLPTARFFVTHGNDVLLGDYVQSWGVSTLQQTSGTASVLNVVRLIGTWDWAHSDGAGHRYIMFAPWYERSVVLFLLSFSLPALALCSLRLAASWKVLLLWAMAIMAVLLMRGSYGVTGSAFFWVFEHIAAFQAFREPFTKFGIPATVCFAILAGLGADSLYRSGGARAYVGIILAACLVVSIWPWWAGQMFRDNAYVPTYYLTVPEAYRNAAAFINKDHQGFSRVLVLPLSPQLSYTTFAWGFNGPDPLPFYIDRPTIVEARSWDSPFADIAFGDIMSSPVALRSAVDRFLIRYAVVHRDIVPAFYGASSSGETESMLQAAGGQLVATFGRGMIAVYRFPIASPATLFLATKFAQGSGLPPLWASRLMHETIYVDPLSVGPARLRLGTGATSVNVAPLPAGAELQLSDGRPALLEKGHWVQQLPVPQSSLLGVDHALFRLGQRVSLVPGRHHVLAGRLGRVQKNWQTADQNESAPWGAAYSMRLRSPSRNVAVAWQFKANPPGYAFVAALFKRRGISLLADFASIPMSRLDGTVLLSAPKSEYLDRIILLGPAATQLSRMSRVFSVVTNYDDNLDFPPFVRSGNGRKEGPGEVLVSGVNRNERLNMLFLLPGPVRKRFSSEWKHVPFTDSLYVQNHAADSGAIDAKIAKPGLLVLNSTYSSDWNGYEEGKKLKRYIVDGVFPGWLVRAGDKIHVTYAGAKVRNVSKAISLISFAFGILMAAFAAMGEFLNRDRVASRN